MDTLSSQALRIADGAAVNQSAFADAFELRPGDAMYRAPEDRISLW